MMTTEKIQAGVLARRMEAGETFYVKQAGQRVRLTGQEDSTLGENGWPMVTFTTEKNDKIRLARDARLLTVA